MSRVGPPWFQSASARGYGELLGQEPLSEIHGPTVGAELERQLRRLEEHVLLLERCYRMVARNIAHLERRHGKAVTSSVKVAQAGQVNVDCAVSNGAARPSQC